MICEALTKTEGKQSKGPEEWNTAQIVTQRLIDRPSTAAGCKVLEVALPIWILVQNDKILTVAR